MSRFRRSAVLALVAALVFCGRAPAGDPAPRPALILLVVIDQFPASLLDALEPRLALGGFRRLIERGTVYRDARYPQAATLTAVGHATIATGALPRQHGIPGNEWYDAAGDAKVYCVADPAHHWVGGKEGEEAGTSPRNLACPTFGDGWRIATGKRAEVVAISLKDRGAILLGGKLGSAYWYDTAAGRFVSSTYYFPGGELPEWLAEFNAARPAERWFRQSWKPLLDEASYRAPGRGRPLEKPIPGLGKGFPFVLGEDLESPAPDFFKALIHTPFGNQMLFDLALAAIDRLRLGQRGITDVLCLSLTANDYCGHVFGPESLEYEDVAIRLDRQLEAFFQAIEARLGAGKVLTALTSDHGVSPSPEFLADNGLAVGRIDPEAIAKAVDAELDGMIGEEDWVAGFLNPGLFLKGKAKLRHYVHADIIQTRAAFVISELPGVAAAFTRSQIADGRLPDTAMARSVAASFHPRLSPDVFIVQEPHWYLYKDLKKYRGMHGSPYAYDTHVPIVLEGPGIRAGIVYRRASPADIAPTLCQLLGIPPPAASVGEVLGEALGRAPQDAGQEAAAGAK
jgi:arylsulfatase A-like enzyme